MKPHHSSSSLSFYLPRPKKGKGYTIGGWCKKMSYVPDSYLTWLAETQAPVWKYFKASYLLYDIPLPSEPQYLEFTRRQWCDQIGCEEKVLQMWLYHRRIPTKMLFKNSAIKCHEPQPAVPPATCNVEDFKYPDNPFPSLQEWCSLHRFDFHAFLVHVLRHREYHGLFKSLGITTKSIPWGQDLRKFTKTGWIEKNKISKQLVSQVFLKYQISYHDFFAPDPQYPTPLPLGADLQRYSVSQWKRKTSAGYLDEVFFQNCPDFFKKVTHFQLPESKTHTLRQWCSLQGYKIERFRNFLTRYGHKVGDFFISDFPASVQYTVPDSKKPAYTIPEWCRIHRYNCSSFWKFLKRNPSLIKKFNVQHRNIKFEIPDDQKFTIMDWCKAKKYKRRTFWNFLKKNPGYKTRFLPHFTSWSFKIPKAQEFTLKEWCAMNQYNYRNYYYFLKKSNLQLSQLFRKGCHQ
jgi:hypothetical protein